MGCDIYCAHDLPPGRPVLVAEMYAQSWRAVDHETQPAWLAPAADAEIECL